jgi:tetratricopeptide (TPR) repeat protein
LKALISGQAGVALLYDQDRIRSVVIDAPSEFTERTEAEASWFLRNLTDLQSFEDVTQQKVVQELEAAWTRDRAMLLLLLLLDRDKDVEIRQSACNCLSELLTAEIVDYLANYFYAAPLPKNSDLPGAIQFARHNRCSNVEEFLFVLEGDQEEIARRVTAWNALPLDLFDSEEAKENFRVAAVKAGAFRMFVTERFKSDYALLQVLALPEFRGKSKDRRIFMEWAAPFKEKVSNVRFFDDDDDIHPNAQRERHERSSGGYQVFLNVEKQKNSIKALLLEGRRDMAFKCIQELVAGQRSNSEPQHIAKSLCDLAQYCKRIGDIQLQLELAEWATRELPTDAWAHAQLADAYRSLGEFENALTAYHRAGVLGDKPIAMCGRGEVLKDLGELTEALEIYQSCVEAFPDQVTPQCGRAEVTREMGRLEEALEIYNAVLRKLPYEVVPLNGRATLLRDLGRLDESLAAYNEILQLFPDELVTLNGRAEVLKQLGKLEDALKQFDYVCARFPLDRVCRLGRANVFKDLGSFDEALTAYDELIARFNMDIIGRNGRADVLRRQNRLDEAIAAYQQNVNSFHGNLIARSGLASALAARGQFDEALSLLPTHSPATFSEWISFQIRGVISLRKGDLDTAIETFEWGLSENPWFTQKDFFETALAGARLRKSQYEQAADLLNRDFYPTVRPIAQIFQLHAFAELRELKNARSMFDKLLERCPPVLLSSRDELGARCGFLPPRSTPKSNYWLFEQESNSLLLAA